MSSRLIPNSKRLGTGIQIVAEKPFDSSRRAAPPAMEAAAPRPASAGAATRPGACGHAKGR
eukprot:1030423-Pleurochrysis_carterae.AAC.1